MVWFGSVSSPEQPDGDELINNVFVLSPLQWCFSSRFCNTTDDRDESLLWGESSIGEQSRALRARWASNTPLFSSYNKRRRFLFWWSLKRLCLRLSSSYSAHSLSPSTLRCWQWWIQKPGALKTQEEPLLYVSQEGRPHRWEPTQSLHLTQPAWLKLSLSCNNRNSIFSKRIVTLWQVDVGWGKLTPLESPDLTAATDGFLFLKALKRGEDSPCRMFSMCERTLLLWLTLPSAVLFQVLTAAVGTCSVDFTATPISTAARTTTKPRRPPRSVKKTLWLLLTRSREYEQLER